jgi:hypothetical protein
MVERLLSLIIFRGGFMYPYEWKGSENPDIKKGIGIFKVDGIEFVLHLEDFESSKHVIIMLDTAFDQGRRFGAVAVRDAVKSASDLTAGGLGA